MNNNFTAAVVNDNAAADLYPRGNTEAQNAYLDALRHFVRLEEEATSHALNHARTLVLRANSADGKTRHWTDLKTADLQLIQPDLTLSRFNLLYGDYKSNVPTPWNTHPAIVHMVGEHLHALGTTKDLYEFGVFLQKHAPACRASHKLIID